MNWTISYKTAVALATVSLFCSVARAADDDDATEPAEAPAAEAKDENAAADQAPSKMEKPFWLLMRCDRIEAGDVQVMVPRSNCWVAAKEGRYYPHGSIVRARYEEGVAPHVTFAFGDKSFVTMTNNAEFTTKEVKIGDIARTLVLRSGRVAIKLPRTLKDGLFSVVSPSFVCSNLAGDSEFDYTENSGNHVVDIRCVTGSMMIGGKHYTFPRLAAANQLRIMAKDDGSYTELTGTRGDCKVTLDAGVMPEKDYDTGVVKEVSRELKFSLSPKCVVKIDRAQATVGGRVSVSVMTFDALEVLKNRFAFAEGRSVINSGELVLSAKTKAAAAAKAKNDDVTEAVAAPAPVAAGAKPVGKKADDAAGDDDAKADDKKADDADDAGDDDKKADAADDKKADDKKADDKKADDDDFI